MNISNILQSQLALIKPSNDELDYLEEETKLLVKLLKEDFRKQKIEAEVFVGGSFAKGTLIREKEYDIDIFARFDLKFDDISAMLERSVKKIGRRLDSKVKRIHGSRDYFMIGRKNNLTFEIVPVYTIKKPREARNITDLSYFHVGYVRKKLNEYKIINEILLAKKFCQAQRVYGAESYIQGFSGYGLECLIIYYKSFLKMMRELSNVEDRIVLDPERLYKNKSDVFFSLNESRLQSPIILIDPTWKERNVLASLSRDSLKRFQNSAKKFLKNPSNSFFELDRFDIENFKKFAQKKKGEFIHLTIETNRQEGSVAGSKIRKFSRVIEFELKKYFDILKKEFVYDAGQKADFYIVAKSKGEIIRLGPPISMEKYAENFKRFHKNAFQKNRYLYSKEKVNLSAMEFLRNFADKENDKLKDMGIIGIDLKGV